jgi:hypothetical protein
MRKKYSQFITRRESIRAATLGLSLQTVKGDDSPPGYPEPTSSIPPRLPEAMTGSQFADSISQMSGEERENSILRELLEGNLPPFLRKFVPVTFRYRYSRERTVSATVFVMPEYLAVGTNNNFLRVPMNFPAALTVAERFGCLLPTRKIVDSIYAQSPCRFIPEPLPPGPRMSSTEYYRLHNKMIDRQSQARNFPLSALVSGHKKDVVLSNHLSTKPNRIAIYGWHRAASVPIQPLSTVHGAGYADYSHGIRLIGRVAIIEGKLRSVHDILRDSELSNLLSDEGAIRLSFLAGV